MSNTECLPLGEAGDAQVQTVVSAMRGWGACRRRKTCVCAWHGFSKAMGFEPGSEG